eukprot:scaffold789_cov75-Phaeocystis_antarctica.AAC.2
MLALAAPTLGQKPPGSHKAHAVAPGVLLKLPAAHGTHAPSPVVFANAPGLQGDAAAAPSRQSWPTGHPCGIAVRARCTSRCLGAHAAHLAVVALCALARARRVRQPGRAAIAPCGAVGWLVRVGHAVAAAGAQPRLRRAASAHAASGAVQAQIQSRITVRARVTRRLDQPDKRALWAREAGVALVALHRALVALVLALRARLTQLAALIGGVGALAAAGCRGGAREAKSAGRAHGTIGLRHQPCCTAVAAPFTRQRRRRADRAERAGPAGPAGNLASLYLVSASLTIVASHHVRVGSHGPAAACCWLANARAAKVPRRTGVAVLLGLQPARSAVAAGGTRECDGAALWTVVRLWASYWLHPLLTTAASEAGGA